MPCRQKALLTLPRGPQESTQSWYAKARLGVYVCTVILWGAGVGKPRVHFFVSRCKEKSGPYSMFIWRYIVRNLVDLKPVKDLCWWSDGGKHFRGNLPIATMCVNGVVELCEKSNHVEHQHIVDLNFGIPSHFKNQCDGAQAHARGLLDEVAKKRVVSTIPDFIATTKALYEEYKADPKKPPRLQATWHDFLPDIDRDVFVTDYCIRFKPSSFKEQISISQAWQCRLNDIRRRKNPRYVNAKGLFSALDFKASMLRDGSRIPAERCCLPELQLDAVPEGAGADAEADADELAEAGVEFEGVFGDGEAGPLAIASTTHLKWQTSYRSQEPEKKDSSMWRKRFTRMRAKWASSGLKLAAPQSRRPIGQQLALQQAWRLRKQIVKGAA